MLASELKVAEARIERRLGPGRAFGAQHGLVCFLCGDRAVSLQSFPWHLKGCIRVKPRRFLYCFGGEVREDK